MEQNTIPKRGKKNNSDNYYKDNKDNTMNNKSNKTNSNTHKALRETIKQEIIKALNNSITLNEGKLEDKVADLYAYSGIKTQYSDSTIERYGQKTVDMAIQMAPEMIKFKKELTNTLKSMMKSPEGKMLIAIKLAGRGYSGNHSKDISIYDLM